MKEFGYSEAVQQRTTGVWNGAASGDNSNVVSGDGTNVPVDSDYEISVVY